MWQLNENQQSRPEATGNQSRDAKLRIQRIAMRIVSHCGRGVTRPEDFVAIQTLQRCSIWTTPTGIKI